MRLAIFALVVSVGCTTKPASTPVETPVPTPALEPPAPSEASARADALLESELFHGARLDQYQQALDARIAQFIEGGWSADPVTPGRAT